VYLERFEQEKIIIKSQLGDEVLDNFMENYPKYKYACGINQIIYGELMTDYWKDFTNLPNIGYKYD